MIKKLPLFLKSKQVSTLFYTLIFLIILFHSISSAGQTAVIGEGTLQGNGILSGNVTGNEAGSKSVQVIRKTALNAAGIASNTAITEWGHKKMSSTDLIGTNQWELKVYLKNAQTFSLTGTPYSTLKNGSTLVYTAIVDKSSFPVEPTYWMWQLQTFFQYTNFDLYCFVEWTPLQAVYNNITHPMRWERSPSGISTLNFISDYNFEETDPVTLSAGYKTRITYLNTDFVGTLSGGTIMASVANANAGAPFSLLASNLSYGTNMVYQWQKSPMGLNQWTDVGPESIFPSRPTNLQSTATDYRLRSKSTTTNQTVFSNVVSIGQNQNVIFTDPNLKAAFIRASVITETVKNLAGNYFKPDANNDGEIQLTEALQIGYFHFDGIGITNIDGIENFTNLTHLSLRTSFLVNVAVPSFQFLTHLSISESNLQSITLGALPVLDVLNLYNNNLTTIDLSSAPLVRNVDLSYNNFQTFTPVGNNLQFLSINNNQLTALNLENTLHLEIIRCQDNQLTELHVESEEDMFGSIICNNNLITTLTVNGMGYIYSVECSNNLLTALDFSHVRLANLYCSDNNLQTINVRNATHEDNLVFSNNPDLIHICADYPDFSYVQGLALAQGYPNLSINDYCSFDAIGTERIITGLSKYSNSGTCENTSIMYPNLRLKWTEDDGGQPYLLGNFYSSSLGIIDIQLPQNITSTIEPELENPEYFTVLPQNLDVNFDDNPAAVIQNFCVTPSGVHHDVQVLLFPVSAARPGFDAMYRLLLRNKGTQVSAGAVTLTFQDNVMDLVSSVPVATNIPNQLSWNYTNLQPFETRTFYTTFNLNSPSDSPPLNSSSMLEFSSAVSTVAADVYDLDNTQIFKQRIVNSFDPNDKTCLEGITVAPEQIGEYVHYVIRFENTGTASAVNVVVKDVLDSEKFDVNSVVLLSNSHSCIMRQRENSYEFIFENINLPFADNENDGFVFFKVKLQNTLAVNDTFNNQAGIYFDYNLPIITNDEVTTIQQLSTKDFAIDTSTVVSPNPSSGIFTINSKNVISSVGVYDIQGRLIETHLGTGNALNLNMSSRSAGIYFLRIITDGGIKMEKIVKK